MSKEVKKIEKTAVFYDALSHHLAMSQSHETSLIFTRAKEKLEQIIDKPIKDYEAFREDILGYSMQSIREVFSKPFELGLSDGATLKMLSINIDQLKTDAEKLRNNPTPFCVCKKTGAVSPDQNPEAHTWYITTKEQHERLKFTTELAAILELASEVTPYVRKANVTNGLAHLVYFDPQTDTLKPNHNYLMQGIQ